jgi:hypothetical protein
MAVNFFCSIAVLVSFLFRIGDSFSVIEQNHAEAFGRG